MNKSINPDLDLEISRIIKAPRIAVWNAWSDPENLAQWWIPHPSKCRVVDFELQPGGAFRTEMSDDGYDYLPHLTACFLDVVPEERIVFTDALTGGWRPKATGFVTAIITFHDHPEGTEYRSIAMHGSQPDRDKHDELGFYDGWGTVAEQLAALVENKGL